MSVATIAKQLGRSPVEVMEIIKEMRGPKTWTKRDMNRLAHFTSHHPCWFVVAMVRDGRKSHM